MTQQNSAGTNEFELKNLQAYSSTSFVRDQIKLIYPNALFVPVCMGKYYYSIYESAEKYGEHLIAELEYIEDHIPTTCPPPNPFGSYFKLIWKTTWPQQK